MRLGTSRAKPHRGGGGGGGGGAKDNMGTGVPAAPGDSSLICGWVLAEQNRTGGGGGGGGAKDNMGTGVPAAHCVPSQLPLATLWQT